MRKFLLVLLLAGLLVSSSGCSIFAGSQAVPTATRSLPSETPRPSATWTPVPSLTPSPTITFTPVPTLTPTVTPWVVRQGPGKVVCPILLYHRIAIPKIDTFSDNVKVYSPYFVTPDEFEAQMKALKEWGYTTITVTALVEAIKNGAELPARPVIISFDDGDITVYQQAFPIMRELGYAGTLYLVKNYINQDGYMDVQMLKEMAAAGWEIGSHSSTHQDLEKTEWLDFEIRQSRRSLEIMLGVPVKTFAYPFGIANFGLREMVLKHYDAGVGLGVYTTQKTKDLSYLWRRPVDMGWDVQKFGSFLPWNSVPEH